MDFSAAEEQAEAVHGSALYTEITKLISARSGRARAENRVERALLFAEPARIVLTIRVLFKSMVSAIRTLPTSYKALKKRVLPRAEFYEADETELSLPSQSAILRCTVLNSSC